MKAFVKSGMVLFFVMAAGPIPAADASGQPFLDRIPVEANRKEVVITINGGPYPATTNGVVSQLDFLEKLKDLGVRATFFLNGSRLRNDPSILNRIKGEGHRIGNFTMDGMDLASENDKSVIENQILPEQLLVQMATGIPPAFFRAPDEGTNAVLFEVLSENNLLACGSSIRSRDLTGGTPSDRAQTIFQQVFPGSIIALEADATDYATLDYLVPLLHSEGYRFAFPRTRSTSSLQSVEQAFRAWSPTANLNLRNTPARDRRGSGFTWKAYTLNNRAFSLGINGLGISLFTENCYAYTVFDRQGGTNATESIDLSGSEALLQLDLVQTVPYADLRLMIFDGSEWFISRDSVYLSGKAGEENFLPLSQVSEWLRVDQSDSLTQNLLNTQPLPALTFATSGTPDLKQVVGAGIFLANRSSLSFSISEFRLLSNRAVKSLDLLPENSPELHREIFGIAMSAYMSESTNPDILAALSEWCELLRWPGGGKMESIDLKNNFLSGIPAVEWIETCRTNVNKELSLIVGAPGSLGMDFWDPDPDYPNFGYMQPTNFSSDLSNWYSRWGGTLPRGVDYVTNMFNYFNNDASTGWGVNDPRVTPPGVEYFEVGNEMDLMAIGRQEGLGRPRPGYALRMAYYSPMFEEYASAMHQASPSTKVLGPSTTQYGFHQMLDWFLKTEASNLVDVITLHRYDNEPDHWRQDIRYIRDMASRWGSDTSRRRKDQIGVGYTEWNSEGDDSALWKKGIFIARVLSKMIGSNVDLATCWHICMHNGRTFYQPNSAGIETPLPSHYAMRFIRRHIDFSQHPRPCDLFLVSTNLEGCALLQEDALVLLIVNSSETQTETTSLKLQNGSFEKTAVIDVMSKGWNGEWEIGVTNRQAQDVVENGAVSWTFAPQTITAIKLIPATTNRPPIPQNDTYEVIQNRNTALPVLENDSDLDGDRLSVVDYTYPQNGNLSLTNGIFFFSPSPGLIGNDAFSYRVTDSCTTSSYVTVQISVVPNQSPVSLSDRATTLKNTPVTIRPLSNDVDPDKDPLSIQRLSEPFHGRVDLLLNGEVLYTPETNFIGSDTFTYAAEDPSGAVSTSSVVRIEIADEQLRFLPDADSFIYANSPDLNFGSRTGLEIRAPGSKYTRFPYLRFTVSGLQPDDQIIGAALRLWADQFDGTLSAYSVSDITWDEHAITWNNAPAPSPTVLGSVSGHSGNWIEIPLTAGSVTGNASYSFRLEASGNWLQSLGAREGEFSPRLVLSLRRAADSDGDSIPDDWETLRAGNLNFLSQTGDYDGDGISDRDEYILDSDPLHTSNLPQTEFTVSSSSGIEIGVESSPERLYIFEYSTNLLRDSWRQLTAPKKGVGGMLVVPDSSVQAEPARYYRVKVSAP